MPAGDAYIVDFALTDSVPKQMRVIDRGRNAGGLRAVNGKLTHGRSERENAAVYFMLDRAPRNVSTIGAVVDLSAASGGSFALLVGRGPVPDTETDPAPPTAVHFVADAEGWIYGVWSPGAGGQTVLAQGRYQHDFDRGSAHFAVDLTGDSAGVLLPDATAVQIRDSRIAEYAGSFATWELFEASAGTVPVAFRKVWVS
ncbi:hypothetical protein [Gordonia iterans]